jgi:hypothetical protein
MKTSISRIEPLLLRPNDVALLNFPEGLIPVRVLSGEFFQYLYDPVAEGQISAEVSASTSTDSARNVGFVTPQLLKSGIIAAQPTNVLRLNNASYFYQAFFGIAPSYVRVFLALPSASSQKNLDVVNWSQAYAAAGWIDGFISPLNDPDPSSETIVPYGVDPAIGYANVLFEPVRPLIMFYLNKIKFAVVTDLDLVLEMLDKRGRGEKAPIKTVGGLTAYTYPYRDVFKIRPIPITATKEEVSKILRGG